VRSLLGWGKAVPEQAVPAAFVDEAARVVDARVASEHLAPAIEALRRVVADHPECSLAWRVAELLARKPDFASRGRVLIGRLVKFLDLLETIADGLGKAGLVLAWRA
jgi:hypothetical protein